MPCRLQEPTTSVRIARTITALLDGIYFIYAVARHLLSERKLSKQFQERQRVIILHAAVGSVVIFSGVVLHIQCELSATCDFATPVYWLLALCALVHVLTSFYLEPLVQGEKRLSVPLYVGASVVNGLNAIYIFSEPSFHTFFRLWMSMNTFVYSRLYGFFLLYAAVDFELLYTFVIIAAAATTYPLSEQLPVVYVLIPASMLYAPFHEFLFGLFGLDTTDMAAHVDVNGSQAPKIKNLELHYRFLDAQAAMLSTFAENCHRKLIRLLSFFESQYHRYMSAYLRNFVCAGQSLTRPFAAKGKTVPLDFFGNKERSKMPFVAVTYSDIYIQTATRDRPPSSTTIDAERTSLL